MTTLRHRLLVTVVFSGAVVALVGASWYLATATYNTDFPVLYRAGRVALDPHMTRAQLYDPAVSTAIPVPEFINPQGAGGMRFVWPAAAAGALAAIAWMPYFVAKTVMILANVIGWVFAIGVFAQSTGASKMLRFQILVASCLWWPFVENLRFGQTNGILLLFVALAAVAARKRRAMQSGLAVAAASVVKVFPLPVAFFLGVVDVRIVIWALVAVSAALLVQPIHPWLTAMAIAVGDHRSFPYHVLPSLGDAAPVVYSGAVMLAGLGVAFQGKRLGPEWLAAFGVVTVLLSSPMAEYYHLTLAVLGPAWLVVKGRGLGFRRELILLPVVLILGSRFLHPLMSKAFMWTSVGTLWVYLAWIAANGTPRGGWIPPGVAADPGRGDVEGGRDGRDQLLPVDDHATGGPRPAGVLW